MEWISPKKPVDFMDTKELKDTMDKGPRLQTGGIAMRWRLCDIKQYAFCYVNTVLRNANGF